MTKPVHIPKTTIHLGTCGWNYAMWTGPFYPTGTRPIDFLKVYARAFDSVEVDSTFYAIPAVKTVRGWASRVDERFEFALKLPQEITHELRLRDAGDPSARFFDAARELGKKLGPILIQLAPSFGPEELPALAEYLPTLPRDIRFAVEFRQRGWITDEVLALLTEQQVALTLSDARWIPRRAMLALAERPTAGLIYVRWIGPDRSLVDHSRIQVDRTKELEQWAKALAAAPPGISIYGYVNNHFAGHSPATVRMLQELLGQRAIEPSLLGEQLELL